ncbi:hypothetical protein RvY_03589-3 [Ramazzottius varieornatus]|uniref:RFX-type winged-helix domain-containing protein n=1 Tax=Ramazzottius varieornatus TaxID=947166 RepID=A0A1D1UUA6_RAMVA|nr:hypothetical protein RvY_03589-3 [Ramazzottius varieornatus]
MLASAAVAEVPVTSTSYMVPPRKKRKIKSSVILDKDIVKWLQRNFRNNAVSVIPRHFVFNKYKEYCEKINKTDTNAACFGKTLRGVFPNMETRRLGSRGSSKYHYAGIEVHPNGDYEDSHPFFKVARRQKFRSTSVSSTDAPSTVSSLPTEPSSDPVSLIEPFPKTSTGPNEDQLHALNVVEVLQKFIDIIPVTGSTSCICPSIRQRLTWTDTLLSVKASKSISGDDLDCFLVHLRVHIAMLARCVLSGAILGMPDIVGNFWVSRKKSLQVPRKDNRKAFDAIISEPTVQHVVRDAYLHLYDALVWRLMANPTSAMPCSLAYVLIDFLHKFPLWCHTAAAFCVQLEKLTRMSELEEKLTTADAKKAEEFAQDSVVALSHFLSETARKFGSTESDNLDEELSQAKLGIGLVHRLLESSSDLTGFHSQLVTCTKQAFAKLEKEFIGGRLLKEKLQALVALQTMWTNIIDKFDTDKPFSKYVTSLWKIVLTIFTEKERAALEKVLPIVAAFTPIAEKLGAQIPEVCSSEDLEVSLPYFVQDNVENLHFLTRPDNLSFYLESSDLRQCLSPNGDVIAADLDR